MCVGGMLLREKGKKKFFEVFNAKCTFKVKQ